MMVSNAGWSENGFILEREAGSLTAAGRFVAAEDTCEAINTRSQVAYSEQTGTYLCDWQVLKHSD